MGKINLMRLKGVDLDEAIARKVFGIKVLGRTVCALPPESGWTAYPGSSPPDKWMCYAGYRPVFLKKCHCAFLRRHDGKPDRKKTFKGHQGMCLGVVPEYSTDIRSALEVVNKVKPDVFALTWNRGVTWSTFSSGTLERPTTTRILQLNDTLEEVFATVICRTALMSVLERRRRKS